MVGRCAVYTAVSYTHLIYASIPLSEAESDLKTLVHLLTSNWQYDISSQVASDLNTKKWNKVMIIPLASDMKIFKNFLNDRSRDLAAKLCLDKKKCRDLYRTS